MNCLTPEQKSEIISETKKSISEMLPSNLKKFLVDIYNNRELIYNLNFCTPDSDIILSIAENEVAQRIIDNYFTLELNKAQRHRNKRDFIDLRETKQYFHETLDKCLSVLYNYDDNKELFAISLLEDCDPEL